MPQRILVIPDKFKGTLTAREAAQAIIQGWRSARPNDSLEMLPMCDGGEGFGDIIGGLLGAEVRRARTVDSAHRPVSAKWWWNARKKTAVIEAARVNGLAMLTPGKFHPFDLDTFGLGKMLLRAEEMGCRQCLVGIGGSATNDGGFGVARSVGWKFYDDSDEEILHWRELSRLQRISAPPPMRMKVVVAVDVKNRLLGREGATRIFGPQKGMRPKDFDPAECALGKLARLVRQELGRDFAKIPGAGAAGGLGFGLMAFLNAEPQSGFKIFSDAANLEKRLRSTDLVITGEGALDRQTLMGKGVGQVAVLCRERSLPCLGLAGFVENPRKARNLFTDARALVDITDESEAKTRSAHWLRKLARNTAEEWNND